MTQRHFPVRGATMAAILLLAAPAAVLAQESPAADKWQFNVVPYVWTAGIDGRLSHDRFPVDIDTSASFGDILKRLDFGAMVAFEGRRGRWGFVSDFLTIAMSDDDLARIPLLNLPVAVRTRTTTGMVGGQFRAVDADAVSIDLMAGARFWSVSTRFNVDIPGGITLPPGITLPRQYADQEKGEWVDGMVGLKTVIAITPGVHLNGSGMIGGGGSKFTSDLYGALGFRLSDSTSLLVGYRHLTMDYSGDKGFKVDATLHGPHIGLGIRF